MAAHYIVVKGKVQTIPPPFLDKWGVWFAVGVVSWILLVSSILLYHFLADQPTAPDLSKITSDEAMQAIGNYRLVYEQWRDSLSYVFDLLVTKTAMPIGTLLLGYLFGRKHS